MEQSRARRWKRPPIDPAKRTVLLVDDDNVAIGMCSKLLQQHGYAVTCATSGAEAREKFSEEFQIAVLDVALQDANGVDLLGELLSARREIVPVMLSGDESFETIAAALEKGAFWYLHKPVHSSEFLEIIRRASGQYELAQRARKIRYALWYMLKQQGTLGNLSEDSITECAELFYQETASPSVHPENQPEVFSSGAPQRQMGLTLADIERRAIIETLLHCGGNKARAARVLGISEKSIYNKLQRLGCLTSKEGHG